MVDKRYCSHSFCHSIQDRICRGLPLFITWIL